MALIAGMRTNFKILLIILLRFLERRLNLIWRDWKTEIKEEKDVTPPTHEPDRQCFARQRKCRDRRVSSRVYSTAAARRMGCLNLHSSFWRENLSKF